MARLTCCRVAGHPAGPRGCAGTGAVDACLTALCSTGCRDTPAHVVTCLGETLLQTPPAARCSATETRLHRPDRSMFLPLVQRPGRPSRLPGPEDHDRH